MSLLQVQARGEANELVIALKYPTVANLTYNFSVQVRINKQNARSQLTSIFHKVIYIPQRQIRVKPIEGNFLYKIQINCSTNGKTFTKTIFSFVPNAPPSQDNQSFQEQERQAIQFSQQESEIQQQPRPSRIGGIKPKVKENKVDPFCRSQDFMRMVGRSVGITNQKKLERYILQGRKSKNTTQFLNSRKEFQLGNGKKAIQKQKMLLKGKMVFRDVYQQSEGLTFFKNDWFMGPFYSYDHNQKDLAKE